MRGESGAEGDSREMLHRLKERAATVMAEPAWISGLPALCAVLIGQGMLGAITFAFAWYSYGEIGAEEAERILSTALRKRGLSAFHIETVLQGTGLPDAIVTKAALRFYEKAAQRVMADLEVTDAEKKALDQLRDRLALSPQKARRVQRKVKASAYSRELGRRLPDGEFSRTEAGELRRIRSALGLATADAYEATRG